MSEPAATRRPALDVIPDWVREHYALVDAAAIDTYVEDFDPDIELRFAGRPPIRGRAAVRDALAAGHQRYALEHTVVNCWECGDTTILEFDVVYTYPDGRTHETPSVAIVHRAASGLLDSLRVYVDPAH